MSRIFQGRPVLPGKIRGEALVTHQGLNLLASYQKSAIKKSNKAICSDQNNPDLYKKDMTGKIICLPQTIGSTSGGLVLETVAEMGIGPAAMLFARKIDSLAAAGVILSNVWLDKKIVTIDQLGEEFLEAVSEGEIIEIKEDGSIILEGIK